MGLGTKEDYRMACAHMIVGRYKGTEPDDAIKQLLRDGNCAGIIDFADNIEEPQQIHQVHSQLQDIAKYQTLFCVDQEGGRVQRIKHPATILPPMKEIGDRGEPQQAFKVGEMLAKELSAMGYHLDFAPVMDVNTNPENPVIGDRAFSDQPDVVAAMGVALIHGLQRNGIAACAKHFPGHGDTEIDSHHGLPKVSHSLQRLREVEWIPFKAAIEAQVASIMSAHVILESIDTDNPGTLSSLVMEFVRKELAFSGVLISDDIGMGALKHISFKERIIGSVLAGIDLILVCSNPEDTMTAYETLIHGWEQGIISNKRIEQSYGRLMTFWQTYVKPIPVFDGELFKIQNFFS